MAPADLYLRQNETRAVGSVQLATGRNAAPDVDFDPDTASLDMGGGGGSNSAGSVLLKEPNDRPRIQLAGAGGSMRTPGELRVYVDGSNGRVQLGETGNDDAETDIDLHPKEARARLGGGGGTNSDGKLRLLAESGDSKVQIDAAADGPTSEQVDVYVTGSDIPAVDQRQVTRDTAVTVDGGDGFVNLGAKGVDGLLTLYRSQDVAGTFETARLAGTSGLLRLGGAPGEGNQRGGVAGTVEVRNEREVAVCEVAGSDATVRVGSQGKGGSNRGADSGTVEVVHEQGMTTAELDGEEGSVVAGGKNTPGAVLLRQEDSSGNVVQYLLEATQNGLVVSTKKTTAGAGSNVKNNQALRVDPDGTVRVKGGSVKPL